MKTTVKLLACALAMSATNVKSQQIEPQVADLGNKSQQNVEQVNQENINKMKFLGNKDSLNEEIVDQKTETQEQKGQLLDKWIDDEDKKKILKNAKGLRSFASHHIQKKFKQMTQFNSATTKDILECQFWDNEHWFNLVPLQKDNDESYYVKGYPQPSQGLQESILYNVCETFNPTANGQWANCETNRAGYLTSNQDTTCKSLTSTDPDTTFSAIRDTETNETLGVNLKYQQSDDKCNTGDGTFGLNLTIMCNADLEKGVVESAHYINSENCVQNVQLESKAGCVAFDLNEVFNLLEKYRFLWGLILFFVGMVMVFFGRKLIKPLSFVVIFLMTSLGFLLLFYTLFLKDNETVWIFWVLLSVCVVLGILVGAIGVKFDRVGIAFMGGVTGFFASLLLLETFQLSNEIAFWIIVGVVSLICFGISFTVSEYIKIISTSLLGGYCVVRGVSCFAGGFPNEFTTVRKLAVGTISSIEWYFYIYLVFIILVSVGGTIWQIKKYKAEDSGHPFHVKNPYKSL